MSSRLIFLRSSSEPSKQVARSSRGRRLCRSGSLTTTETRFSFSSNTSSSSLDSRSSRRILFRTETEQSSSRSRRSAPSRRRGLVLVTSGGFSGFRKGEQSSSRRSGRGSRSWSRSRGPSSLLRGVPEQAACGRRFRDGTVRTIIARRISLTETIDTVREDSRGGSRVGSLVPKAEESTRGRSSRGGSRGRPDTSTCTSQSGFSRISLRSDKTTDSRLCGLSRLCSETKPTSRRRSRCLCRCRSLILLRRLSTESSLTPEPAKQSSTRSTSFRSLRVPIVLGSSFTASRCVSEQTTCSRSRGRGSGRSRSGRTEETRFSSPAKQPSARLTLTGSISFRRLAEQPTRRSRSGLLVLCRFGRPEQPTPGRAPSEQTTRRRCRTPSSSPAAKEVRARGRSGRLSGRRRTPSEPKRSGFRPSRRSLSTEP